MARPPDNRARARSGLWASLVVALLLLSGAGTQARLRRGADGPILRARAALEQPARRLLAVCEPGPDNPVQDGGFEGGTPSPSWAEASTNFGTPLCTTTRCGGDGGGTGARSGFWWAWLGGSEATEQASLEQSVTIPVGYDTLRFWLEIPAASGNGVDVLRVLLDGQPVLEVFEDAAGYELYAPVTIDVNAWADDASHLLRFEVEQQGTPSATTSFFVDDVALCALDTGACCDGQACSDGIDEAVCVGAGGSYAGDGSSCGDLPPPCEPRGACCGSGTGGCLDLDRGSCEAGGGSYLGDGSQCAGQPCALPGCEPVAGGPIGDPGFEAGTPNPDWSEASDNFSTPLCDEAGCGSSVGSGPRGGSWWAWFGGVDRRERASLEQLITIPVDVDTLSVQLEIPVPSGNGSDAMQVLLDGQLLQLVAESQPGYGVYAPLLLDVSAFADGGQHLLRLEVDFSGSPIGSSFFVDDLGLCTRVTQGACCDQQGGCLDQSPQQECEAGGGVWAGAGSTCGDLPPPCGPEGACCDGVGGCADGLNQLACEAGGGEWVGAGSACDDLPSPCAPDLGACCDGAGGCVDAQSQQDCEAAGGEWAGAGSGCDDVPSPCGGSPVGACCDGAGGCVDAQSQPDCEAAGGVWAGAGSACDDVPPPCGMPEGACCDPAGGCADGQTQAACEAGGGLWAGAGVACAEGPCSVSDCVPSPANPVVDGGFEAGTPSAAWAEASDNFGTPLCEVALCGDALGVSSRSGDWWAWFGGADRQENASLEQQLTIPAGLERLGFWLTIPERSGSDADRLEVLLDGQQLFRVTGATNGYYRYDQVLLDVSAFADGGQHVLRFELLQNGTPNSSSSFFVDEVALCNAAGEACTLQGGEQPVSFPPLEPPKQFPWLYQQTCEPDDLRLARLVDATPANGNDEGPVDGAAGTLELFQLGCGCAPDQRLCLGKDAAGSRLLMWLCP